MATARKLPSGNYRCQIFSHYTYVNGKKKRVYESFTAPTKREAEAAAALWSCERSERGQDITVAEAVERYIVAKTSVLSPATIRGYRSYQRTGFDRIAGVRLRQLDNETVQIWISSVSTSCGAKTTRNIYMLLTASVRMFSPGKTFSVSLPPRKKLTYNLPSESTMKTLLDHTKGTELWIALMLAYNYGLRRGEICALTSEDLHGDTLTISRDVVLDENNLWVTKDIPKTEESYRSLMIAEPLLGVLQAKDGKFITCNPDALLNRFRRALKAAKVDPFNFHLLRHCYASRAAVLGVPDVYVAKMGGWKPGSPVLKSVYQNALDEELRKQMERMNAAALS